MWPEEVSKAAARRSRPKRPPQGAQALRLWAYNRSSLSMGLWLWPIEASSIAKGVGITDTLFRVPREAMA